MNCELAYVSVQNTFQLVNNALKKIFIFISILAINEQQSTQGLEIITNSPVKKNQEGIHLKASTSGIFLRK